MKLKSIQVEKAPRRTRSAVNISKKGVIFFTMTACEEIKLRIGEGIEIMEGEEPGDLFLVKNPASKYKLRVVGGNIIGIADINLARKLLKICNADPEMLSVSYRLVSEPVQDDNGVVAYPIITGKPVNKKRSR
jgi:hypothetical protein